MNLKKYASMIGCAMMESMTKRNTMEISKSDRDAMIDLLYDMYDADLVDVALETLGENELFDGIPAILEDYYYYFDEDY
jgi:hypothetical protein